MWNSFASVSDTLPVESCLVAGAKYLECPRLADRIGSDEDPVLPRRQPSEYACLQRLTRTEPKTRLQACQGVRGESATLLQSDSNLVLPVEFVGSRSDQSEAVRLFGVQ